MPRSPRLLLLASSAVIGLMIPGAVHSAPDGAGGYVVEPGDYLFGIAREQGVALRDLLQVNGLTLTSVIHPGQRLVLPTSVASPTTGGGTPSPTTVSGTPSPTTGSGTYTVRPGDSLYGIARRHGMPLASLLAANGLTLTSVIHPGRQLTIPAGGSSSAPANPTTSTPSPTSNSPIPTTGSGSYTVRSGDSLYGVARRHGVPLASLLASNGLTLTSVIHPGRQLTIPAGNTSSAPATGTTTLPAPPSTVPAPIGGPPSTVAPTPVSAAEVERIIREVWPDDLENTALAIAWRESRYQPAARSVCCSGLFQLYYDVHRSWLSGLGVDSREDLSDPRTNAVAAYALYQRAGWWPWA